MTLFILAIWLYIGWYGVRRSRKRGQKGITLTWSLLTIVIAFYIISTLFI